ASMIRMSRFLLSIKLFYRLSVSEIGGNAQPAIENSADDGYRFDPPILRERVGSLFQRRVGGGAAPIPTVSSI
ncbi:MAG: hypothetical protein ACXWWP_09920, partial [Candidatus Binatia bacterium]